MHDFLGSVFAHHCVGRFWQAFSVAKVSYRLTAGFACSVHWRFHRHNMVIQSAIISFDLISNINRSSQLGHRRQSIGSCWRYLVSNVCPRQSIGRRQTRSNTYELPRSALQHFCSSWLIKQLDLFSSASHLYS